MGGNDLGLVNRNELLGSVKTDLLYGSRWQIGACVHTAFADKKRSKNNRRWCGAGVCHRGRSNARLIQVASSGNFNARYQAVQVPEICKKGL